jgi:hypothetical protein
MQPAPRLKLAAATTTISFLAFTTLHLLFKQKHQPLKSSNLLTLQPVSMKTSKSGRTVDEEQVWFAFD